MLFRPRWSPTLPMALLFLSAAAAAPAGEDDLDEEPTGTIAGVVLDGWDRPVGGIEVVGRPEGASPRDAGRCRARTDAEGRFTLKECVGRPNQVEVLRWAGWTSFIDDRGDLGSEPVAGVLPGTSDLRLFLPVPGSVVGTVVDGGGTPLRGVAVYLNRGDRPHDGGGWGTMAGTVPVPCHLVEGRLVPDNPQVGVRERRVRAWVKEGEAPPPDPGPLEEPPHSWRCRDDRVEIGRDGSFRVPEIRRGRWRLEIDDIRAMPASLDFAVLEGGEARPHLTVIRRGWLSAVVRDPEGRPLAGATVAVLDSKAAAIPVLVETEVLGRFGGMSSPATLRERFEEIIRTGEAGTTMRRYLDPGAHTVRVLAEGRRQFETAIEVAEGRETAIEVTLEREP